MSSVIVFFLFIPILAVVLLSLNLLLAPHNPYEEKNSVFECGFHSFLKQNRSQFTIAFFRYGMLFMLFDIELLFGYPFVVSAYINSGFGLIILLIFFSLLTIGLVFELGKNALTIETRQTSNDSFDLNKQIEKNLATPIQIKTVASTSGKLEPFKYTIGRRYFSTSRPAWVDDPNKRKISSDTEADSASKKAKTEGDNYLNSVSEYNDKLKKFEHNNNNHEYAVGKMDKAILSLCTNYDDLLKRNTEYMSGGTLELLESAHQEALHTVRSVEKHKEKELIESQTNYDKRHADIQHVIKGTDVIKNTPGMPDSVIADASELSEKANLLRIGAMTNEERYQKLQTRKNDLIKSAEELNLISPGESQSQPKSALLQDKGVLGTTQDKPTPVPSQNKDVSISDPDKGSPGPEPDNGGANPPADSGGANPPADSGGANPPADNGDANPPPDNKGATRDDPILIDSPRVDNKSATRNNLISIHSSSYALEEEKDILTLNAKITRWLCQVLYGNNPLTGQGKSGKDDYDYGNPCNEPQDFFWDD